MSTTHSKDYWRAIRHEDYYAGMAANYDEAEPANTAALSSDNWPVNENQKYPVAEYIQVAHEAAGQKGDEKKTFTKDLMVKPGTKKHRVQNTTWIDKAVAFNEKDGVLPDETGASLGADLGSWTEVFKRGANAGYKGAYGCYIQTYVLNLASNDYPTEEITYGAFNVKNITDANFSTPKDWSGATLKIHKDFTVTIDGNPAAEIVALTLTINLTFTSEDKKAAGSYYHKHPRFEKYEITVDVTLRDYHTVLIDTETEAANLMTITIAGWGKTLTLGEMKLQDGSGNVSEVPEKGMKEYKGIFEIGGDCSPATA